MYRAKLVEIKRVIENYGRIRAKADCTATEQMMALELAMQTVAAALAVAEAAIRADERTRVMAAVTMSLRPFMPDDTMRGNALADIWQTIEP